MPIHLQVVSNQKREAKLVCLRLQMFAGDSILVFSQATATTTATSTTDSRP